MHIRTHIKNLSVAVQLLAVTGLVTTALACRSQAIAPVGSPEEATRCSGLQAQYDETNVRRCTAFLALPGISGEDRGMAFNKRGNTYDALKKYDLAVADYTEVIKLLPSFEYGYANRALANCRKLNFTAAIADYSQALRVNPKSSYALYGRGIARIRSGDTAGGKADLSAANLQDPDMANVYRSIGMTP